MARGNPAMRAKRVTGPTPNTVLLTACKCETCSVKGCNEPPLRTSSKDGTILRECRTHVMYGAQVKQSQIVSRGWRPPWMP